MCKEFIESWNPFLLFIIYHIWHQIYVCNLKIKRSSLNTFSSKAANINCFFCIFFLNPLKYYYLARESFSCMCAIACVFFILYSFVLCAENILIFNERVQEMGIVVTKEHSHTLYNLEKYYYYYFFYFSLPPPFRYSPDPSNEGGNPRTPWASAMQARASQNYYADRASTMQTKPPLCRPCLRYAVNEPPPLRSGIRMFLKITVIYWLSW